MPDPKPIPALRQWDGTHGAPDGDDAARVQLVMRRWHEQDGVLLNRDRTVEENVRMLAGRQWDVFSDVLGQFVDVTRYLTDEEKRWRQRPVVNLLQYWFLLTHARLTESAPEVQFQPSTADWRDQELAEVLDPIFKTQWSESGMDEAFVRAAAWLIAGGECYIESAVDWAQGPQQSLTGNAMLPGPNGQQMPTEGPVPYDAQGQPVASVTPDGQGYAVPDDAEPYTSHEGCLCPRVRSPLEVRAEWGADQAWEDKKWVTTVSYVTPAEVEEYYEQEVSGDTPNDGAAGYLQRLLFSSGHFGAVSNRVGAQTTGQTVGEYVAVYAMWERPSALSPETPDSPGGRLLVVTRDMVLHDSVRPYRCKGAAPVRRAQFIQQPGRGGFGSTPLEQLVPIQKTYNRGWAQILEHRNLCTNPILLIDSASGIDGVVSNLPGQTISVDFTATNGNPPATYLTPPPLSADVWRIQGMLLDVMMRLGSIAGAEGQPQTDDPSGQLVSELRFNSDRPVSVAARSLAHLVAGVMEDWIAIFPVIWPIEKTIDYAGEDQMYRTIDVSPELWDGNVHVRPDLVNARIESPEVKEQRVMTLWQNGAFGVPGQDPKANETMLELAKFPHMQRIGQQNSPDAATCRQLMGHLAQGADVQAIMALLKPWYNYDVWMTIVRDHLASPDYLKYDPAQQQAFAQFYSMIQMARIQAAATLAPVAASTAAPMVAAQGMLARLAQTSGPQDPALAQNGPADSPSPSGPTQAPGAPTASPS